MCVSMHTEKSMERDILLWNLEPRICHTFTLLGFCIWLLTPHKFWKVNDHFRACVCEMLNTPNRALSSACFSCLLAHTFQPHMVLHKTTQHGNNPPPPIKLCPAHVSLGFLHMFLHIFFGPAWFCIKTQVLHVLCSAQFIFCFAFRSAGFEL